MLFRSGRCVGAGVGLAVGVLRWLEQLTVLRKVAPVGSATHDQILGVLRCLTVFLLGCTTVHSHQQDTWGRKDPDRTECTYMLSLSSKGSTHG